jgi:DNA-binding response OmpR family regulator
LDPPAADAGRAGASVLLAEHDEAVAGMLVRYLTRDGLAVRLAATPELALAGLADAADAVAVLDLTMPELDPRRIRQALRTPVVFLAAPGPRPRGLSAGGLSAGGLKGAAARRWLTRPFAPRQLVATVRELLREDDRQSPARLDSQTVLAAGALVLDGRRRTAVMAGREVPLTGTEFAILAALLATPGRPRSRPQLLAAAASTAEDRSVDVHVAQLRAKLGVPGLIRTVRRAGFVVDAPAAPARSELGADPNLRGSSPGG